jgi:BirA family transcriptional regulator, biotin operon repressor / biotin---[acetyl-CoA-carboxylase] ligase
MRLSPEAEAAGYRLTALDQTGSTNDEALAAARAGDPGRHWFVARRQSAGRGRHGRAWASPAGNLHASLLLVDPCPAASAPQLGFVAGLALHDAVAEIAALEAGRLALKWPNDLLLDGAKLAGLLLEGQFVQPGNAFAVVIGIGVNVATAPDGAPYPTRALAEVAPAATADALFERLGAAFARRFERWHAAQGAPPAFASVRAEWLARAAGVGGRVTLRLPSGEREGAFRGLDPSGRLELDTPSGVEVIDAGDLYFPTLDASPAPRPAT